MTSMQHQQLLEPNHTFVGAAARYPGGLKMPEDTAVWCFSVASVLFSVRC
jgi:hypothetical protein